MKNKKRILGKKGRLYKMATLLLTGIYLLASCIWMPPASQVKAETETVNITGYAMARVSITGWLQCYHSHGARYIVGTLGMTPVFSVQNFALYSMEPLHAPFDSTMSVSISPGIYSDPALTDLISNKTGTSAVSITDTSGMTSPMLATQSSGVGAPDRPRAASYSPETYWAALAGGSATAQLSTKVGGTTYNSTSLSITMPPYSHSYTWDGVVTNYDKTFVPSEYKDIRDTGSSWVDVVIPVTYSGTDYFDPVVTNSPDLVKDLNDPISVVDDWNEGIEAEWGSTSTNKIPTMGTIKDDTLVAGTDVTLSTLGTVFDRVGWADHTYTIKDDHSLSSLPQYAGDNTFKTVQRKVIVRALTAPTLDITYGAGAVDKDNASIAGNPYGGEWTNQALDIKGTSVDPGTYDMTIMKDSPLTPPTVKSEIGFLAGNTHTETGYFVESPSDKLGEDIYSVLLGVGDHTIELSPESAKQNVKIDFTDPNPVLTYTALTGFVDSSTDALSGIDSTRQKIAVMDVGVIPTDADYEPISSVNKNPGVYDVWLWAWDNAGNNVKQKMLNSVVIASTLSPDIEGLLASGPNAGDVLPSGTWTNQDVTVNVSCPVPDIPGDHYNALYDSITTLQEDKGGAYHDVATNTYSAETPSTTLHGIQVNAADVPLSAPTTPYMVQIDKTIPVADVLYNGGPSYDFMDTSTDTLSPVGANSGVDGMLTQVAIVPYNLPPTAGDYGGVASAVLPAVGYYDVWVIATDVAGNESVPVKAYEHISRSGLDDIQAKDFSYGIDQGAAAFTDTLSRDMSYVEAIFQGGGIVPVPSIIVDGTDSAAIIGNITAGIKGSNPLTFSTPDINFPSTQASTQIAVTLFDHGNGGPGTEKIYANDFSYGISSGNMDEITARLLSNVDAKDANGDPIAVGSVIVDATELATINAAIASKDKSGNPFPLTFTTPVDGISVTVDVTLKDNSSPVGGSDVITGNDFDYGIDEGPLSDTDAMIYGMIEAVTDTGVNIPHSSLTVDVTDLAAINAAIAAGDKSGNPFPLKVSIRSAEVTIYVTLRDHGFSGASHITGDDFKYGIDQGAIIDDLAKLYSYVAATDSAGVPVPLSGIGVNLAELANINLAIAAGDKSGNPHPLTFYIIADGTDVTVDVTLYDHGGGPIVPTADSERIVADDFFYGVDQPNINDLMAKVLGRAVGTEKGGAMMPVGSITVDAGELGAINAAIDSDTVGKYPLTYVTPDGTSATITVTLKDHGAPDIDPTTPVISSEQIAANDFSYGINETNPMLDDVAKILSSVVGKDGAGVTMPAGSITVDSGELGAINAGITSGVLGPYPLTFYTPDGTNVTITVTLKHQGGGVIDPVTPSNNTEHITANNFSYGVNEIKLTEDIAKILGNVDGVDVDGDPISFGLLTADGPELQHIVDQQVAGVLGDYPLTFYTPDGTNVTITVTLKDQGGGTVVPGGAEHITANDFSYGLDEVMITEDIAKALGRAEAIDASANPIDVGDILVDPIDFQVIKDAMVAGTDGIYDLTFSTVGGTAVTVKVTLRDHGGGTVDPTDPTNNTDRITGSDYSYGINEIDITPDAAKWLASVDARDKDGNKLDLATDVTTDLAQLTAINSAKNAGQKGPYPLTFTTPDGTSITVTVTLKDAGGGSAGNSARMAADHFTYHVSGGELTDAQVKDLANLLAKDANGIRLERKDTAVFSAHLDAINDSIRNNRDGDHPVKFVAADGTEVAVTAKLIKDPDAASGGRSGNSRLIGRIPKTGNMGFVLLGMTTLIGGAILLGKGYKKKTK